MNPIFRIEANEGPICGILETLALRLDWASDAQCRFGRE